MPCSSRWRQREEWSHTCQESTNCLLLRRAPDKHPESTALWTLWFWPGRSETLAVRPKVCISQQTYIRRTLCSHASRLNEFSSKFISVTSFSVKFSIIDDVLCMCVCVFIFKNENHFPSPLILLSDFVWSLKFYFLHSYCLPRNILAEMEMMVGDRV